MATIDRIPPATLQALAAILSPYVPGATPAAIVAALRIAAAGDRPADPARRRLLSLVEAGRALGVSPYTIRRRVADGTLRGVQVGSQWRVSIEAVEALAAGEPLR